jgi:glycosyltransferase involved in cell wall biosynthesis
MPEALPRVTVVTPSYNYARFIGACLTSVRGQTYPRLEHIVVDGGSTDGSVDIIQSLAGAYDVHILAGQDRGPADALNKGFARARGDLLCWLNADDFWLHDRVVEEAVRAFMDGAIDVVTATGFFVDAGGRRLRRWPVKPSWVLAELRYYDSILQPATFWRGTIHRELRADLGYTFDWRLWLDLQHAGARFAVRDHEWAAYRMHHVNRTASDPAGRRFEVARVLAEECGPASPQHLWALGMYGAYRGADALGSRALRRAAQLANVAMSKITRRRVFSC